MIAAREKRVLHTYMHSLFDKAVFQKLPGYWYWSERLKGFRLQSLILPHLLLSTYSAFCKVQSLSQIASICFFVHPTLKIFCLWNQLLIMLFARLLNLPVFVSKVRCFPSWDPAFLGSRLRLLLLSIGSRCKSLRDCIDQLRHFETT